MLSRRAFLGSGAASLIAVSSGYADQGFISAPDPYLIAFKNQTFPDWNNTKNKTQVSAVLDGAKRNILLMVAGQSNLCNLNPTPFVPTNTTKIINFNLLDGAAYQAVDPLLGVTNNSLTVPAGCPAGRIADTLITNNVCDVVWLLMVAEGATAIADWNTGGLVADRIPAMVARLAARGIPASRIDGVIWGQGETDTTNGTSQAAYAASLSSVITNSRTAGITAPWFIAKQTYNVGTISAAVQAAQVGIVNHGLGIWAGPDADSLGSGSRYDNLHFSDAGAASYAAAWVTALHLFGAPF